MTLKGLTAATRTHCPYCALQCGMAIGGTRAAATVEGSAEWPVNKGALCVKGWTSTSVLSHPDRLLAPLGALVVLRVLAAVHTGWRFSWRALPPIEASAEPATR